MHNLKLLSPKYIFGLSLILTAGLLFLSVALQAAPIVQADKVKVQISAEMGRATNIESNAEFAVRVSRVYWGEQYYYLHALAPLSIPVGTPIEIKFKSANGFETSVRLPQEMKRLFINYLRNGGATTDRFDCVAFVYFLNAKKLNAFYDESDGWVVTELIGGEKLFAGDTIFIGQDRYHQTHFAVYLGQGFYLSKFGVSGPLIIANLPAMKKGFTGDRVFRITLKK